MLDAALTGPAASLPPTLQLLPPCSHFYRKDVLDAALTRAGRFDRSIEVRRPDFNGRLEGIKVGVN